ncbi:CoxG family protein [Acidovorax sp. ST3]|uniref:CoxG family protein n=1 Tax=Acidovorax sp. ST3 TaxID=2219062 RepID=UPI000DA641F4|nr:SRPBCC domain-containing protein [Acidovorax sp. ST3]
MDFRIDATLPASAAQLWAIFFDVQRVAGLIPGCENVTEIEPLKAFSALMKQKIGPFKLELPTTIVLGAYTLERHVELSAQGRDKLTGTSIEVHMAVNLNERQGESGPECVLGVEAQMQVAGKLASLGYPVVKKKSDELFAEFERRLRNELAGFSPEQAAPVAPAQVIARAALGSAPAAPAPLGPVPAPAPAPVSAPAPAAQRPARGVELVLQWPRVGISVAVACVVAYAATTAFQQSPGWWLVAPLLGVAAGLGRRAD